MGKSKRVITSFDDEDMYYELPSKDVAKSKRRIKGEMKKILKGKKKNRRRLEED